MHPRCHHKGRLQDLTYEIIHIHFNTFQKQFKPLSKEILKMITDILQNKIPKPTVLLTYNGNDCTKDFLQYLRSLSHTDYEDENSDELNISLNNNDGYFSDLWYPEKGDKLTCSINFDGMTFDCGTFTIDDNSFTFDVSGDDVEIKAVAASTNKPVRTRKYKNYSGKTLKEIAEDKGKDNGFIVIGSEGDGTVLAGKFKPKNNEKCVKGRYAKKEQLSDAKGFYYVSDNFYEKLI